MPLARLSLVTSAEDIASQKLARPEAGNPSEYEHLQPILSKPIDWDLIKNQYDEMIKFATALRLGTAETEAILRRFTRNNLQHPTYQALSELGRDQDHFPLPVPDQRRLSGSDAALLRPRQSVWHPAAGYDRTPSHSAGGRIMNSHRTSPKKKARELAKYLRAERPDYPYLKSVFRALRTELEVEISKAEHRLPEVPTEEELRQFYQVAWQTRNFADMILIKTLFYTGVRVSELVSIRLADVDVERCQIRINHGKGDKDRQVPFRELLALHMQRMREKQATYLFESVRKKKYTDRGVRKMLERYARAAGISRSMSPRKWRHFLFTWLKKQGIDDALIQPYSGHESRQSLEIYSRLSLADAQKEYNQVMGRFPIQ
nr:tyrosine-type recombinase/integrase [Thermogemmatispora aurantia]